MKPDEWPSNVAEAMALYNERTEARQKKDWDIADAIREELKEMGWTVEDKPGDTLIYYNKYNRKR